MSSQNVVVVVVVALSTSLSTSLSNSLDLSLASPHNTPTTAISKNREYSDLKQLVDKAGLASELGPSFSGSVLAPVKMISFVLSFFSFNSFLALTHNSLFSFSPLFSYQNRAHQNNAAFDQVARAGGPKVSDFLNGSPQDLKKLLFFHLLQQKVQPSDLALDKTLQTRLPGALLKVVPAPGGGVAIAPASYNGAAAGPGGPGSVLILFFSFFFSFFVFGARGDDRKRKLIFSLSRSLSLSSPPLPPHKQRSPPATPRFCRSTRS